MQNNVVTTCKPMVYLLWPKRNPPGPILVCMGIVEAPRVAAGPAAVEPMKGNSSGLEDGKQPLSELLHGDEADELARCPETAAHAGAFASAHAGEYCPISDR